MSWKTDVLPKRKSPRISGYDYDTPNYYFITVCTHEKQCLFGDPEKLNCNGIIVKKCLEKIPSISPGIMLEKYVVMPNHIHAIFVIQGEKNQTNISTVIGQFKMSVTKEIRKGEPKKEVWQRSFHDHVIRNEADYQRIWTYIENNPQKWEEDCFYCR